jgi:hypothetical protein
LIDPVIVYQYTYWDDASKAHKTSTMYAPREVILAGLGSPITTSGIKVERADLRDGRFYMPEKAEQMQHLRGTS